MSHDRGCPCGKEMGEYHECEKSDCFKSYARTKYIWDKQKRDELAGMISDEQLDRVHAYANFGDMSNRDVLIDGLLNLAVGFSCGHTQLQILREHGLTLGSRRNVGYTPKLSAKGKKYLMASIRGEPFDILKKALREKKG